MTYDLSDPRVSLNPAAATARPVCGLVASEQLGLFYAEPPQLAEDGEKSWFLRGKNFVLVHSDCAPGTVLERRNQPDEYVALLYDRNMLSVLRWRDQILGISGPQIAFIPSGSSRIELPNGGRVTRLFTTASNDMAAACPNSSAYDQPREHIPPFKPWPEPEGGWRIRANTLDISPELGRFGRIFRCTTFMVNILEPFIGPRDPSKLSPHHHDDFEQCSLALSGRFTHHLRWPWTTDLADWRKDRHIDIGWPSALVIPPHVIHTSQATGVDINILVDIFCPPRIDFSLKEGWVINASDYPMPTFAG